MTTSGSGTAREGLKLADIGPTEFVDVKARGVTPDHLADVSDGALWAEVERRQLVICIGYVNPDAVQDVAEDFSTTKGHVLWSRTWMSRWPVYGLRGGDSITASNEGDVL